MLTTLPTAMPERNFDLTRSSMCSCITPRSIAQLCTNIYTQCHIALGKSEKDLKKKTCNDVSNVSTLLVRLQTRRLRATDYRALGDSCIEIWALLCRQSSLFVAHLPHNCGFGMVRFRTYYQRSPPQTTYDRLRTRQINPETRSLHHLHGAAACEDRTQPACLHHVAHIDRLGNGAVFLVSCCTNE